ncbi:PQQ-binding-like beta-propeller repeat protein [Streptomyces filipinensis]|uniref:PQQ-binding-like beta-propeller repeat protein n=1 Tax=Streptomyces filipinensis TaxID=66887 RepID=UPI001E34CF2C|nr:PQQ-binding-like beta-propeller repeat protein [Streptomyces filipinensis]
MATPPPAHHPPHTTPVRRAVPRAPSSTTPRPAPPATPHRGTARVRRVLPLLAGVLLAVGLLGAAHHVRSVPYGDRFVPAVHGERPAAAGAWTSRARGAEVVAYDTRSGAPRWRYARVGRRPVAVLTTGGQAVALWDDGLLTGTDGRSVRWHRALPDAAEWLPGQGGTGVLRPLGRGILAVVTPHRVSAYRLADGDLRWLLPARTSCAFRPEGAVRRGTALLIAQPCARGAWTGQLVALDDLGRITPDRTPLGNGPRRRGPNART